MCETEESQSEALDMRVACFTKSFQDWPLERVCRELAAIGLDGLDLTVRKDGSIDPADAAKELPAAIETAHQHGLKILQITSDITDPGPRAEQVLFRGCKHGINRVKLGYYPYEPFGTLAKQMDDVPRPVECGSETRGSIQGVALRTHSFRQRHSLARHDALRVDQGHAARRDRCLCRSVAHDARRRRVRLAARAGSAGALDQARGDQEL